MRSRYFKHLKFLKDYWQTILFIALAGICAALLEGLSVALVFPLLQNVNTANISLPFPFNLIMNFFANFDFFKRMAIMAGLLIIATAIKEALLFFKNISVTKISITISKHFQLECVKQMMHMGMGYFNSKKSGDFYTIISAHAFNLGVSLSRFGEIIEMPFIVFTMLSVLLLISWKATLISLLLAVFLTISIKGLLHRTDIASRRLSPAQKSMAANILDIIAGMKVIRLFNRQADASKKFQVSITNYYDTFFRIRELECMMSPFMHFTSIIIVGIIIVSFSWLLPQDKAASLLIIFLLAFTRLVNPVMSINRARISFIGDRPYFKEVFDFLETKDKQHLENGIKVFTGLKKEIKFADVGFIYPNSKPVVLKNISFAVEKGTKLGIVGPSGGGKSTVTELLLRVYDPCCGAILIDGEPLKTFDINSWRSHIGVVSQDIFLFNDTIRNNIAFANPGAGISEIEDAALKAYAHDFILSLPEGYDTLIGERGVLLSGGQRQRIAIARAIILDPDILIFDEATSSLDSASEKIVQKAIDGISEGRTVVTVSHRLSTVFDSDKILVINSGSIVEEGKHKELMVKNGIYSKLAKMQEMEVQIKEQGIAERNP